MAISEEIHRIGFFADKAFDGKDTQTLKKLSEDCFHWIDDDKYSVLEKGILAYYGATSCCNYIDLHYNGALYYSDEENNEDVFEMCLYLFRKAIVCLSESKDKLNNIEENKEDIYFCSTYLHMAYVNFANILRQCGRIIKAISYLRIGVGQDFPMAVGNFAGILMDYAHFDYDEGHRLVFANESYQLLIEVLENTSVQIHCDAREHYNKLFEKIKAYYPFEFLEKPYEFDKYSLGDCDEEINYRKWCLKNVLFLNTLNDVFLNSVAANDILHLPNIVAKIDEGPRFHGLFNQIKQEYASARYMVYASLNNRETHFSDKGVYLVNTLDYPIYGIGVEKMKYAYRSLYSLFDRMAYLVNEFFGLGIKSQDVSYRSIWRKRAGRGKGSYELNINLKKRMTTDATFNLPLIGFYWLCKDIGKQKFKHHYLDPSVEKLAKIRHHIEHRYLKVHDSVLFPVMRDSCTNRDDPLAYSITFDELEDAVMKLLSYVREAIILLSLAIHVEERLKERDCTSNQQIMQMHMGQFDDDWKQIF